ncbi:MULTISPECIES: DUF2127 domain-containing protein [unclassified Lysobacter]|uniref:DUF2127 domain-containing protein n=1 Tax=unclassified Lysobacter TaxID=2635362 RepID=UPI001C21ACB0|nr:DUF2127 domain-containing protein [Lysobacter sp. MMG2]MBU8975320.1 DUF2127 domain-containing protein [Lysobacter sp. MMG2]
MTDATYDSRPQAHPGLHAIAIFEAAKGLLAFAAASGLELLGPAPLLRWLHELMTRFQLDPQTGALARFSDLINPDSVHLAAGLIFAYGILRFVEAWGLWRVKVWASWLGCISAAIYLPLDVYALFRHPGWMSVAVLAINLIVVAVLARDIRKRRP